MAYRWWMERSAGPASSNRDCRPQWLLPGSPWEKTDKWWLRSGCATLMLRSSCEKRHYSLGFGEPVFSFAVFGISLLGIWDHIIQTCFSHKFFRFVEVVTKPGALKWWKTVFGALNNASVICSRWNPARKILFLLKGNSVVNNSDICKATPNNSHLSSNVHYKFLVTCRYFLFSSQRYGR